MRVEDLMTEDPVWIDARATVGEAAQKLDESSVRHLPVLDRGVVIGILSDRDVRTALPKLETIVEDLERFARIIGTPVAEIMTRRVATVEPDRDVHDVVDLMLEHRVGAIVVVDPQSSKLLGIISYVDVLRAVRDLVWG